MKKPELLVTPHDLKHLEALIAAGADAFILGETKFSLRLVADFDLDELQAGVNLIKAHDKKVYVAINGIMSNSLLADLEEYLSKIKDLPIDALRFTDPGAYVLAKAIAPQLSLHYSSDALGTNYVTVNYWLERGIRRVTLAPELTKDAILETKHQARGEIEILIHGAISMFQSRRRLITNYLEFQDNKTTNIGSSQHGYSLFDQEREVAYPIFEDEQGTHIFNGSDVCMIDDLSELIDHDVDSFRIEGLFKSRDYLIKVTKAYRMALDLCLQNREKYQQIKETLAQEIVAIQPHDRPLDRGFFYRPTIYKTKA